jgi:hypothetical protein
MRTFVRIAFLLIFCILASSSTKAGTATPIVCPNNGQTGNSANCVQPPVLDFGKQGTSTASMAIPISVNNCAPVLLNGVAQIAACTGSGSLTLSATPFAISGTNAADFTFSLGGCTSNLVIATGGTCSGTITFTPTASANTSESATLTVSDNGTTATQTMSLTGISATVTTIAACGALSSSTNYQLTANLSAAGSCLTEAGSNIDVNLNGFTITYCTSSSSSIVAGVAMTGNSTSLTVHNGTITDSTGSCTGTISSGYSSSDVGATSGGGTTKGTTVFNMTLTQKAKTGKIVLEENQSDTTATPVTTVHDVIFTDLDPGNCTTVGCRAESQFYSIYSDQGFNRPATGGTDQFYNITGSMGPQGAISDTAPMNCSNNLMNPGQTAANATVANGYVCQDWGPNTTIKNNLLIGTGTGGSTVSTRGFMVSSANNRAVTGTVVQGNNGIVRILDNDAEYACASVEFGSTYGMQLNTAGSGQNLSNNTFTGNNVTVLAGPCGAYAFSQSSATNTSGVNLSQNNNWICRGVSGWTQTASVNCAGMRFDGNQYAPGNGAGVETFDSQQDTFSGDSADLYIWFDGNAAWKCTSCTFDKPATAIAGWHFLDENNGGSSGGSSGPFTFIDPTFTNGATKSSNNLATWASNNSGNTFSYNIQWTYTVTAKDSSGAPLNGAAVTIKDVNSTTECSGTTNSSGIFSCILNDTKYQASGGVYTTPSSNPTSFQISATGCQTLNYSETVVATTTETKNLVGCGTPATTPGVVILVGQVTMSGEVQP